MADWSALESIFGLGDEAETAAPPAKPRAPKVVKSFWCVTAQPSGAPNDLGEMAPCHYFVTGDTLTLCDQNGNTGENSKSCRLVAGEHERDAAGRLKRSERPAGELVEGFNRRLNYRPLGLA